MSKIIVALGMAVLLIGDGFAAISTENSTLVPNPSYLDFVEPENGSFPNPNAPFLVYSALTEATTSSITESLRSGAVECSSLPVEYRADCAAQAYNECSVKTRGRDYAKAKQEIRKAGRRLSSLVSENEDKQAELLVRGNKKYRAVKKSTVQAVNQKALKIITETETKLLRSSASGSRKTHYQRIAQAVNSTKIIFRS